MKMNMNRWSSVLCLLVFGLLLPSCDSDKQPGADPGRDGSGPGPGVDGGTDGGGGPGGDGGDTVQCRQSPPVFPSFDKHCSVPGDCAIALHQYNCCGSKKAIGINAAERARFDRDEAACEAQYPGCGCDQQPTLAEDGNASMEPDDIAVDCRGNACTTFVRGRVGAACKADAECGTGECVTEAQDATFAGGYCTVKNCDDKTRPCPSGSECRGSAAGGTPICLSLCQVSACRSPYLCCGPGPMARWCAPSESQVCHLR